MVGSINNNNNNDEADDGRETWPVSSSSSSSSSSSPLENQKQSKLPLLSLNHVSFVCHNVYLSVKFYQDVLGFVLIKRPSSFDFEGAWLFKEGIGIHLLEGENVGAKRGAINPKDNHISFQCTDMGLIVRKLEDMGIDYVTAVVKEGGVTVDQLFFHDPDGYMIEICNCQNLPVLPLSSCPLKKLPAVNNYHHHHRRMLHSSNYGSKGQYCSVVEMMENLTASMMGISI